MVTRMARRDREQRLEGRERERPAARRGGGVCGRAPSRWTLHDSGGWTKEGIGEARRLGSGVSAWEGWGGGILFEKKKKKKRIGLVGDLQG